MKLTQEEGRNIVCGEQAGWLNVVGTEKVVDTSRWSIQYEGIFKHLESGKFYRLNWQVGATESQDESPFEYDKPEPCEVEEREVTKKEWVPVEDKN